MQRQPAASETSWHSSAVSIKTADLSKEIPKQFEIWYSDYSSPARTAAIFAVPLTTFSSVIPKTLKHLYQPVGNVPINIKQQQKPALLDEQGWFYNTSSFRSLIREYIRRLSKRAVPLSQYKPACNSLPVSKPHCNKSRPFRYNSNVPSKNNARQ